MNPDEPMTPEDAERAHLRGPESGAGPDPRRIHHLPRDAEFLIELPDGVQVLEIVVNEPG